MTIAEYDQECDCEACKEERERRNAKHLPTGCPNSIPDPAKRKASLERVRLDLWDRILQAEDEIGTITHEIDLCDQALNEARECAAMGIPAPTAAGGEAMTRSQRNITPGKGDISTWLDCPYIGKDDWSKLGDRCRHDKGCNNPCIWNLGTRTCPEGYAR